VIHRFLTFLLREAILGTLQIDKIQEGVLDGDRRPVRCSCLSRVVAVCR
jgi:hypothetical protein